MIRPTVVAGCVLATALVAAARAEVSPLRLAQSAPVAPRSAQECQILRQALDSEFRALDAQYDACLIGAPRDLGPVAAQSGCQHLLTRRDQARQRVQAEDAECRRRLAEQQQKHKRDQKARQRRSDDSKARDATRQQDDESAAPPWSESERQALEKVFRRHEDRQKAIQPDDSPASGP